MIKSIRFEDKSDPDEVFFDVVVETEFSEQELQAKADAIVKTFEKKCKDIRVSFHWNFEDVIREMENKVFIKRVKNDSCVIQL